MLMLIDDADVIKFERELRETARHLMPKATASALNKAVSNAQYEIRKHLGKRMVLRNKWTQGSIQTNHAYGRNMALQAAEVGSAMDYMRQQEEGVALTSTGKHGYPVPTGYAGGQMGKRPRTKLVRKPMKMANIALRSHKSAGRTDKQRNVRSAQEAVRTGQRFVFLSYPRRKGIFKIVGGRKGTKRGWPKGAKLRLVWEMSRRVRRVPKNEWLEPQVKKTIDMLPGFYVHAILEQLAKHGMLMQG